MEEINDFLDKYEKLDIAKFKFTHLYLNKNSNIDLKTYRGYELFYSNLIKEGQMVLGYSLFCKDYNIN
jgi:hypothetical protein